MVKPPMAPASARIALPRSFDGLLVKQDLTEIFRDRHSVRVYTQEEISLSQFSYLLWATQGVKDVVGKSYVTLRTVPSGGARHEFECYLGVRRVTGLRTGLYHYLPLEHAVELLENPENLEEEITKLLCGQSWAAKASVLFLWSMVPYRVEWRYGIYSHRPALMDIGHVGENLYLACTGLGLGTWRHCGVLPRGSAAACWAWTGRRSTLPTPCRVGTISTSDRGEERAFYQVPADAIP